MRKMYLVPNLITTANIVFGFSSIIFTSKGEFTKAAWMIVAAGICDLLDGRIARLAKVTSNFGVQYDSLSDLTSFGIAPAVLLYGHTAIYFPTVSTGIMSSAFYAVCAALRLARFNVTSENPVMLRKGYFQGMPSPVAAGMMVSAVLFQYETLIFPSSIFDWFFLGLGIFCAVLMVTTIPFPSFKDFRWNSIKNIFFILALVLVLIFSLIQPEITFFPVGCVYLVGSLIWAVYLLSQKRKKSVTSP